MMKMMKVMKMEISMKVIMRRKGRMEVRYRCFLWFVDWSFTIYCFACLLIPEIVPLYLFTLPFKNEC